MPTNLRKEGGKLKLHRRSHMPGGRRFSFRGHNDVADRLASRTKRLAKNIKYGKKAG